MIVNLDIIDKNGLNILPLLHWWKHALAVSLPLWRRWKRDTLCLYWLHLGLYFLPLRYTFLKILQTLLHRYQTRTILELQLTLVMLVFLVFVKWLIKPIILFLQYISPPLEVIIKGSVFFISPYNWAFASLIYQDQLPRRGMITPVTKQSCYWIVSSIFGNRNLLYQQHVVLWSSSDYYTW